MFVLRELKNRFERMQVEVEELKVLMKSIPN